MSLISFVFFVLSQIDGAIEGSPESEVDNLVAMRLKDVIEEVEIADNMEKYKKLKEI